MSQKTLGYNKAIEIMRLPQTRLVRMYTNSSPEGFSHFIIPGGYVTPDVAQKIKDHPLVSPSSDGLFPNHDQTWRMISSRQET